MSELNLQADLPMKGSLNDGPEEKAIEEVKEAPAEEAVEEKETPAELPADDSKESEKPTGADGVNASGDDGDKLGEQLRGLQEERVKLLKEIQELRGQRRDLKKDELAKVENKIDELADVNPQDINLVEKVLRAKGYMTREEAERMSYESVQNEELDKFLTEYPEYKPENDPQDVNWNTLQRALLLYAKPRDPKQWATVLRKAHRDVAPVNTAPSVEVKKQQLKTAGVGSGGNKSASSNRKSFDPVKRQALRDGGWSEEEIVKMESTL